MVLLKIQRQIWLDSGKRVMAAPRPYSDRDQRYNDARKRTGICGRPPSYKG